MDKSKSQITPDEYLDLFEKAMKKLSLAVEKPIGEARTLIYFEHLHTYSIEEIQDAVDRAIHEEEYSQIAPVGKLIRYIEEAREAKREKIGFLQMGRLLEEKRLSKEESKAEAKKLLTMLNGKALEIEEREQSERKVKWEAKKKVLVGQVRLMVLNSNKEE